jgi:phosphocarrier protein
MKREYMIIDEAGLHARPASLLVQAASKFSNNIHLEFENKKVNLKSVLLVMSLGVPMNSTIFIDVDGDDAEVVFVSLEKVLSDHKLIG